MQPDDKIKDIFSSRLKDLEPQTPKGMWNKIEQSIVSEQNHVLARKTSLRQVIALASGIAAILVLGLLFLMNNSSSKQLSSETPAETNFPVATNGNYTTASSNIHDNSNILPQNQALYANTIVKSSLETQVNKVELEYNNENKILEKAPPTPSESSQKTKQNKSKDLHLEEKIAAFEKLGQGKNTEPLPNNSKSKANSKGFSLLFGGSSSLSESDNKRTTAPRNFLRYAMASGNSNMIQQANSPEISDAQVKMIHNQPISFGLKANKKLTNNFSVETGLVCTYLSSQIKPIEDSNGYEVEGSQKFYYLGIPVSANYTFAHLKKAEFHISVGGMIQKDISGKISGDQQIKNLYITTPVEDRISDKINQNNPQLSIMSNTGESYPVYDKLSAYATIGGAYYFDAKNKYRTIYSDKKLQLDLNVGIKLNF